MSSGDVDVGHALFSREILNFPVYTEESYSQDTNIPSAGGFCFPIQIYTDYFPVENLYRRREMAHNFYINLFATAWPLGISVHLCSQYIDHEHSEVFSHPAARTNAQFMDRHRYFTLLSMAICFIGESFYCSDKGTVF